jgi:hypothetical protein
LGYELGDERFSDPFVGAEEWHRVAAKVRKRPFEKRRRG